MDINGLSSIKLYTENPQGSSPQNEDKASAEPLQENFSPEKADQARRESILSWHSTQREMLGTLREIQPGISGITSELGKLHTEVSNALGGIMNFSDRITREYVLMLANQLIDIYNKLSGVYGYHLPAAEERGDRQYLSAVQNYRVFMDMIADSLAAFGIEEIANAPGDRFNGFFHEAVNTDSFSPDTAVIAESVLSGFKYGDLVIQKQKIKV